MIDPLIRGAMTGAISIILLAGAWGKARDLRNWFDAIAEYGLVPGAWTIPVGLFMLTLEFAGGLFVSVRAGASMALAVLTIATGAMSVNLLRGRRHIRCGCGGIGGEQRISWPLVVRNLILIGCTYGTILVAAAREITVPDRFIAAAAAIALAGLYFAVDQILAIQPRLGALRRN